MIAGGVTFAPGRRIGNYELLVELASGGTAAVGLAVYRGAEGFERLVVVKRVHRHLTKDPELMAMIVDEARLASAIRHPNVVPVIDVVRADEELVLVMDYVESVSLAQLAKEATRDGKRLPAAVVSRVLVDVLVGLHEAHEAVDLRRQPLGIVHRDVSPQNVLVGVDGIGRVIDFGIAKATGRGAQTRAGTIKGKCAYMAPEQVDGLPVDRRCDLFAAGIVLWEGLTGARLFKGEDDFDDMRRVMRATIPAPSSVAPELGADVDALLAHALSRPVDARFQTARAFARALEQAIPPAPARVVGEHVEAICGAILSDRHARLLALLGDELQKISPRLPLRSSAGKLAAAQQTATPVGAGAGARREATVRIAGAPLPGPAPASAAATAAAAAAPATAAAAATASATNGRTLRSTDASAAADAPVESDVAIELPRRSGLPALLAITIAAIVLGAGAGAVWVSRSNAGPDARATASASATAGTPGSAAGTGPIAPSAPSATGSAAGPNGATSPTSAATTAVSGAPATSARRFARGDPALRAPAS